jgi:hypothetical protein
LGRCDRTNKQDRCDAGERDPHRRAETRIAGDDPGGGTGRAPGQPPGGDEGPRPAQRLPSGEGAGCASAPDLRQGRDG